MHAGTPTEAFRYHNTFVSRYTAFRDSTSTDAVVIMYTGTHSREQLIILCSRSKWSNTVSGMV